LGFVQHLLYFPMLNPHICVKQKFLFIVDIVQS